MTTINLEELLAGSATVAWDDTAMSTTAKRTSTPIELGDNCLDVSFQPQWEDGSSVLGGFGVEISNHDPDDEVWTTAVADTDFFAIGDPPATNDGAQMIHGSLRAKWARLVYTNVSGTGTLTDDVPVNGKRSGQ